MPEIKPTCLCATAALAIVLAAAPAIAWEPNKPVEIVVAAGAGGDCCAPASEASWALAAAGQAVLATQSAIAIFREFTCVTPSGGFKWLLIQGARL